METSGRNIPTAPTHDTTCALTPRGFKSNGKRDAHISLISVPYLRTFDEARLGLSIIVSICGPLREECSSLEDRAARDTGYRRRAARYALRCIRGILPARCSEYV